MNTYIIRWKDSLRDLSWFHILCASLFISLLAQIRIPLYFTPVPITGQTLAVMLVGIFLGRSRGSLAVICYLGEACMGLPVLAGGHSGLAHLVGPSGGYLMGFVAQAYMIGWLFEQKNFLGRIPAFFKIFIPSLVELVFGTLWLAQFVGWSHVWTLGFFPFVLGEIIKSLVANSSFRTYERHISLLR